MNDALNELRNALPPEAVDLTDDGRFRASLDNLRFSRLPQAVIRPSDEEMVSTVLVLANRHRVPVLARGAGSATTGATTPAENGWVIDLSAWKNLHIDADSMIAYAQPGVTVEELDRAARAHGLFYPPDPGSKKHATLGGTLSCNAGGLRGAKYGVTRDYVLSLEGCLPTGEFVRWAAPLRKFVAGYNLRDLWIGAEGTLGVITGAAVRLLPAPTEQATALLAFASGTAALEGVRRILRTRRIPSILEFLDRPSVRGTLAFWKKTAPAKLDALPLYIRENSPPLLLVECDGAEGRARADLDILIEAVSGLAEDITVSATPEEAENLWAVRRGCSQAMFELGDTKLNEDVVVPLDIQEPLLNFVRQTEREIALPMPVFGHAADGNFHVHILYTAADTDAAKRAAEGIRRLMEFVVENGGAISGEHGIGLAKTPFLPLQLSEAEIGAMRRIKAALDPNNILNPGKLWEPFEVWNHPRTSVRLPWDH